MAINKDKNVAVQVTFPKEDADDLETIKTAFNEKGVKVSKSDILLQALREYIKRLIMIDKLNEAKKKAESEQAKEDKKDA